MFRCEICGEPLSSTAMSVHHRRPRGMGGTKRADTNYPSNLMAICGTGTSGCHGYVESHREEAYEKGWLVSQNEEPSSVALKSYLYGTVYFDDEGGYRNV